ncbi:hypothetical protein [Colwellia psychrerythraea]|uniref:Uncharacterized protein n=1 Tax=Colwellia psychrerythraea TaxID=28229 RepID=A0A099KN57_COLPS|nr:hypothetical protein [Colwellia psychrerythraea]KGJ91916.1 hypothetical protein GAB14E_3073 [Colwellia psychrerythraea]
MNKYVYIGIIVPVILSFVFVAQRWRSIVPLPKKFSEYNFLSEGDVASESYEVVKLFDTWKGPTIVDGIIHLDAVIYDSEKEIVLFETHVIDYDKIDDEVEEKLPYRVFLKISKDGIFSDSITLDYSSSLHNSGIIYYNDCYIDWANSGDKTKKDYTDIISDENLTLQQLDNLIKGASAFDLAIDYDNDLTNLYLRHESGIKLIQSKKLYKNTEGSFGPIRMPTLKPYKVSYTPRFEEIHYAYEKPKNGVMTDLTYSIDTEYFIKNEKHSSSLGDYNNTRRVGWDGIGYFNLEHNSEFIKFKGYAFKEKLDRHLVYYPIGKDKSLAIIYLNKTAYDLRPFENTGVYVIRPKQGQNNIN